MKITRNPETCFCSDSKEIKSEKEILFYVFSILRHEYQRATHSMKQRIETYFSCPDVIESCLPQIQLALRVLYNAETLPKILKDGSSFHRTIRILMPFGRTFLQAISCEIAIGRAEVEFPLFAHNI